jgi:hypothetical protein
VRVLLSIFLCLAVVFQGIAYSRTIERPCSMAQGTVDSVMVHSDSLGDCCNDGHTVSKTGKPCKTGQACSPTGAFVITAFQAVAFVRSEFPPALANMFFMPSLERSSLWRPPSHS